MPQQTRSYVLSVSVDQVIGTGALAPLAPAVTLYDGNSIQLSVVKADQDAHLYVAYVGGDGSRTILLGSQGAPTDVLRAGQESRFPPMGKSLRVRRDGQEQSLYVVASTRVLSEAEIYARLTPEQASSSAAAVLAGVTDRAGDSDPIRSKDRPTPTGGRWLRAAADKEGIAVVRFWYVAMTKPPSDS